MAQRVHEKGAPVLREFEPSCMVLRPVAKVSPGQSLEPSSLNGDLRLELTAEGELVVITPTGIESIDQNPEVNL